jgi:hypothetical protein
MKKLSTKSVKKSAVKSVTIFAATEKAYKARKSGAKFEPSAITDRVRSVLGNSSVKHATVVRYLNKLGAQYNHSTGKFEKC